MVEENVLNGNQWSINKRPRKLDDVFGQDKIIKQFKNLNLNKKSYPNAMWFEGRYGCGKTTIAKIVAKTIQCRNKDSEGNPCGTCLSCQSIDNEKFDRNTLMFNAGANGLVDAVRELIQQTEFPPMLDGHWVVMIEEAQKLSDGAVQALLKTVEAPRSNVHFIFTSMEEDQNVFEMKSMKNFKALKSRCRVYKIDMATVSELMLYMRRILKDEPEICAKLPDNFDVCIQAIANHSNGSYRTAIQTLEECIDSEAFTPEELAEQFGIVDSKNVFSALVDIMNGNCSEIVKSTFIEGSPEARKANFTEAYKNIGSAKIYRTFKSDDGDDYYKNEVKALASNKNLDILCNCISEILEHCSKEYFDRIYCGIKICDALKMCKNDCVETKDEKPVEMSSKIESTVSSTRLRPTLTTRVQPTVTTSVIERMTTEQVVTNTTSFDTLPKVETNQIRPTVEKSSSTERQVRQLNTRPMPTTQTPITNENAFVGGRQRPN